MLSAWCCPVVVLILVAANEQLVQGSNSISCRFDRKRCCQRWRMPPRWTWKEDKGSMVLNIRKAEIEDHALLRSRPQNNSNSDQVCLLTLRYSLGINAGASLTVFVEIPKLRRRKQWTTTNPTRSEQTVHNITIHCYSPLYRIVLEGKKIADNSHSVHDDGGGHDDDNDEDDEHEDDNEEEGNGSRDEQKDEDYEIRIYRVVYRIFDKHVSTSPTPTSTATVPDSTATTPGSTGKPKHKDTKLMIIIIVVCVVAVVLLMAVGVVLCARHDKGSVNEKTELLKSPSPPLTPSSMGAEATLFSMDTVHFTPHPRELSHRRGRSHSEEDVRTYTARPYPPVDDNVYNRLHVHDSGKTESAIIDNPYDRVCLVPVADDSCQNDDGDGLAAVLTGTGTYEAISDFHGLMTSRLAINPQSLVNDHSNETSHGDDKYDNGLGTC